MAKDKEEKNTDQKVSSKEKSNSKSVKDDSSKKKKLRLRNYLLKLKRFRN